MRKSFAVMAARCKSGTFNDLGAFKTHQGDIARCPVISGRGKQPDKDTLAHGFAFCAVAFDANHIHINRAMNHGFKGGFHHHERRGIFNKFTFIRSWTRCEIADFFQNVGFTARQDTKGAVGNGDNRLSFEVKITGTQQGEVIIMNPLHEVADFFGIFRFGIGLVFGKLVYRILGQRAHIHPITNGGIAIFKAEV